MTNKLEILIDSNDWHNAEADRDVAVNLLHQKLDDLDSDEYNVIAAFLLAERASGGSFDFSNENTKCKYADEIAQKLHSLESEAFSEATKDWNRQPDNGYNLTCYVKKYV